MFEPNFPDSGMTELEKQEELMKEGNAFYEKEVRKIIAQEELEQEAKSRGQLLPERIFGKIMPIGSYRKSIGL